MNMDKNILNQKINEILRNYGPKHFGRGIIADHVLFEFLKEKTSDYPEMNPVQRAWIVVNEKSPVCEKSNKPLRWKSFQDGFGFCGKSSQCECAKSSVSEKVSKSKQNLPQEEKDNIQKKRESTNLERYGVANAGQTEEAISAHKKIYENQEMVAEISTKIKRTNIEKYGVDNPMKSEEIKEKSKSTIQEKYGVDNISKLPERREASSTISKETWKKRKEENFDYHSLNQKYQTLQQVKFISLPEDYKGTVGSIKYHFECLICSTKFEDYIYCGHLPKCKNCHPTQYSFKSGEENEVFDFLKSIGVSLHQRNRSLIYPYELDMVCEQQKIAVEYCGIYWHCEQSQQKYKDYHLNKMLLCQEKGYRLITIFSDEWNYKKEIVKSKLASIFGKNSTKSVGARKCNIIKVSNHQAKEFYENYHIQGWTAGNIHFGLIYQEKLVACMSFGGARMFTNNKLMDGTFELLRYATCLNVVGGAGKILKHFEKQYSPKVLYSYADARWSSGNMYTQLGFVQDDSKIKPGYSYTRDYIKRVHRFNWTKSKLVKLGHDSSLTEWEIMQSLGWDRIWDCGQLKFFKYY